MKNGRTSPGKRAGQWNAAGRFFTIFRESVVKGRHFVYKREWIIMRTGILYLKFPAEVIRRKDSVRDPLQQRKPEEGWKTAADKAPGFRKRIRFRNIYYKEGS